MSAKSDLENGMISLAMVFKYTDGEFIVVNEYDGQRMIPVGIGIDFS